MCSLASSHRLPRRIRCSARWAKISAKRQSAISYYILTTWYVLCAQREHRKYSGRTDCREGEQRNQSLVAPPNGYKYATEVESGGLGVLKRSPQKFGAIKKWAFLFAGYATEVGRASSLNQGVDATGTSLDAPEVDATDIVTCTPAQVKGQIREKIQIREIKKRAAPRDGTGAGV